MDKSSQQIVDDQKTEIDDLQRRLDASEFDMPMLSIAEGVLMVPLVGMIDSVKSQRIMEDILMYIKLNESRVVVMDIAGITAVDSSVAAHLIKITKAAKLMGCDSIVSGVSPIIAQNIVNLGVDTSMMRTQATLKDSLREAYSLIGYKLVKLDNG